MTAIYFCLRHHPESVDEDKKRKRKRNGIMDDESMDSPLECPLLNAMEKRCRGVDMLSGDMHQELLPICAVHQLCYLCVS